ncbi:MAG: radical SAM protein [Desulfobacterales bacterium]
MLNGIHFILTYACNFTCDHCFLYCSPTSSGTFTIAKVRAVLDEARKIETVEWIYFEGGEPFLYFPLLHESICLATAAGFKTGVVTNAYGAATREDAELWLKPLAIAGLTLLNVSNDAFHYENITENPAANAYAAARDIGIAASQITIERPRVSESSTNEENKGNPLIGGGAKFRGRAAEKLTDNLPLRQWDTLCECPYEDLQTPSRVHVDAFGNVHICQGISIGNMWLTPLSNLICDYRFEAHPICGPLIRGGPAQLARESGIAYEARYVDECHFCYSLRKTGIDRFPDCLGPRQVYGLPEDPTKGISP